MVLLKGHMSYTTIPIHVMVRNMSQYNDDDEIFKSTRSNTTSKKLYNAASSDVPAGCPREDVRTVPVQLTLFDPKDIDIVVEQGIEPTFRSFEKA
jgi:hypothetical protein